MSIYSTILESAGISVYKPAFVTLDEASQLKITDETLTKMFKFITDKYNSLDFEEIEKSAGDFSRFKYRELLYDNIEILRNIYSASTDPGAKSYMDVVNATDSVMKYLDSRTRDFSDLYKRGNGIVQLLYTSMVAACIYSVGTLISNTIRFVTVEQETDCQVLFDEIPGTMKHVHIKNIMSASESIPTIDKLINELNRTEKSRKAVNESITVTGATLGVLVVAGVIMLIPRIIILIREIIYSIYYSRVKKSEMLEAQIQLLKTNIESLESGRGNKKVIARQKKIVDKLQKWQNRIAVKMDTTELAMKQQKTREDKELKLDRNNPIVQKAVSMDEPDSATILI